MRYSTYNAIPHNPKSKKHPYETLENQGFQAKIELHPKSWTKKSTKGVQKSMGKELFSEKLKSAKNI